MSTQSIEQLKDNWDNIFSKLGKSISNSLFLVVIALMKGGSSNTAEIARQMTTINELSFNSNDVKLRRLLYNNDFQVDDKTWRCYFRLLFGLLQEREQLQSEQFIPINIDFTTVEDRFLLLFASIPFLGRGIPVYFSMRNYPKKAGKIDQKRMEEAFIKELRKLLPRQFKYLIVADRGFGNVRFMKVCKENGFAYLLRTQATWNVEIKKLSEA